MAGRAIPGLILGVSISMLAAGVQAQPHSWALTLEAAQLSLSSSYDGESPAGSGLEHGGSLDDDTLFGVSFEYELTRSIGVRAGILSGSLPVAAASSCPSPPCAFTRGGARVIIADADWRVRGDASFRFLFLEVPFAVRPSSKVQLFAGPTIAFVEVGDVSSPGLDGLIVDVGASSPALGLHAGATLDMGWKRKWRVGLVARGVRTDLDYTVRQPVLQPIREKFTAEEDLVTVGFVVGRRFGGSE